MNEPRTGLGWGPSWVALALALALHVWDEATHDFLALYNPLVASIRDRLPFLPLPTFTFRVWLTGLVAGILIMLATSVFAFRGVRWFRPVSFALALIMIINGLMHAVGSVYYAEPIPGLYSSPVLVAASLWLLIQLRRAHRTAPRRSM
jgi:hypothetical protein